MTQIISNSDLKKYRHDANKILQHIHEWFNANLISLNWEKNHFMHFTTKINSFTNFHIIFKDKQINYSWQYKISWLNSG
jgi:hypothetical protein